MLDEVPGGGDVSTSSGRSRGHGHRPTIKDVASAAGVSPMTASRVVNGVGNVEPGRRRAVEQAIIDLGYRRNPAAHALRSHGAPSWIIGFIVDDIKDSFFSQLARSVEDALAERGSMLLVASSDARAHRAEELVRDLVAHNVDALIIAPPPGDQSYLSPTVTLGRPVLCVDRPPASAGVPAIVSDNRGGARAAIDHLVARGHRDIAYIGDDLGYTMRHRFDGYREALQAHGLAKRPELVRMDAYTASSVPAIVSELLTLDEPPTALFTARNVTSLGALVGLHQLGRQREIAQIGFDDLDLGTVVDPALSVVAQRLDDIGRQIVENLVSRLQGHPTAETVTTVPVDLVRRGSSEIPGPRRSGTVARARC